MNKEDFSYLHYKKTLEKLKEEHAFVTFSNCSSQDVILRHDIDISLKVAKHIAKIENDLGIKSTYFILLHSPFYDPFSTESLEIIFEIMNLGHQIGLHYDAKYILENNLHPNETIKNELKLMEEHFKTPINVVSAHNPTTNKKIELKLESHILDADSQKYKENRKYLSDSVQNWREGSFSNFVQYKNLYILTHPIWWTEDNKERNQILQDLMDGELSMHKKEIEELRIFQDEYLDNLKNSSKISK